MKPKFDKTRPLSWSAISSFEYDPEQWYASYVLGIKSTSKEMQFGSMIDQKIQDDPVFLPELRRYPLMQHRMKATFSGIDLVGIADGYHFDEKELGDYKTGKKIWDQKRADETGQLTMYGLLLYLTNAIKPEDMIFYIHWLPTEETGGFEIKLVEPVIIQTFKTKRTMSDLLEFGSRIKRIHKEMALYAKMHP